MNLRHRQDLMIFGLPMQADNVFGFSSRISKERCGLKRAEEVLQEKAFFKKCICNQLLTYFLIIWK